MLSTLKIKQLFYWQNELIQEWQRNCNLGHANYSKPETKERNITFQKKGKLGKAALYERPLKMLTLKIKQPVILPEKWIHSGIAENCNLR